MDYNPEQFLVHQGLPIDAIAWFKCYPSGYDGSGFNAFRSWNVIDASRFNGQVYGRRAFVAKFMVLLP